MNKEQKRYFWSHILSKWKNLGRKPLGFSPRRILIHRFDEIGDLVLTIDAIRRLKRKYPKAEIIFWGKFPAITLLTHETSVDDWVVEPEKPIGLFDLMIDFRESELSMKWARENAVYLRYGRGSIRFQNKRSKTPHAHETVTNLQVIQPLFEEPLIPEFAAIELSARNRSNAKLFLQRRVLERFAVLHISANRLLKRWSIDGFAELAKWLRAEKGMDILFVGTDADSADVEKVRNRLDFYTYSFIGEGDLLDFAAVVSEASLMVGNDSGPMHISASMGTPTLGLFGPGEPAVFGPYGKNAHFIHLKLDCNPCDQLNCIHPDNPCMNRITFEMVKAKVELMLA